jgi:hypothetical protein
LSSNRGWRGGKGALPGSKIPRKNSTATTDNIPDNTNAAEAPVHAIKAPANAGPAANAELRANSSRPLALAKPSTGTKAGTSEGAATLKATVPTAAMNPITAKAMMLTCPITIKKNNSNKAKARSDSAKIIKRLREVRSANKPKGMDSSKKGKDWTEATNPISPGPACSKSTATIGTAAKLSCSADWANKLDQAKRRKEADSITNNQKKKPHTR